MDQTSQNAINYYRSAKSASQSDKPALILQYCHAAIAERERGDMELYRIGTDLVSLIGGVEMPPVKLADGKLEPRFALLDELYGVAGDLDLAGQGGTTQAADEQLWYKFKQLVERLDKVYSAA